MRTVFILVATTALLAHTAGITDHGHVQWKFYGRKLDSGFCEIHLCATIDKGWYIFSQYSDGPGSTTIKFSRNSGIKLKGPVTEQGKIKSTREAIFDVPVKEISGQVEFVQKIYLKNTITEPITGFIRIFPCDGKTCLPPETRAFEIPLN